MFTGSPFLPFRTVVIALEGAEEDFLFALACALVISALLALAV
jgi:hypothetical protein